MSRVTFRVIAGAIVAIAVLAAGVATPPAAAQEHRAGDVERAPGAVEHRGRSYDVEYGALWVPMNRSDPESPPIRLRFVRYQSTSPTPGAPAVYLAGGPGGSGISTLQGSRGAVLLELLDQRDLIAFDQRGTGASEPGGVMFDPGLDVRLDQPIDADEHCALARQASRTMLETMAARGIDLRGLTTAESADDLDALRVAVGAEKLVLWGSSYGTHLALATARRHPDRVAALVLAGTEGPDHTFKLPSNIEANLTSLAALVREDPVYAERLPDLAGAIRTVLDDLERNPRAVTLIQGFDVTVGKRDLQSWLSRPMGSRRGMERIPATVYAMTHGEFFDLAFWAVGARQSDMMSAMTIAMDCASYATAARLERIASEAPATALGAEIDAPFPCLCDAPGVPRLDDAFRGPLVSSIPALFISGTLDGRTPVGNAEEIARGFENAQHLVIERAAHGWDLFESSPKIVPSIKAFLRGERIPETRIDGPTWHFAPPYERSLASEILRGMTTEGYDATLARYRKLRAEHEGRYVYVFAEATLNDLGFAIMGAGMVELGVQILRLNAEAYPESARAWDRLGEASMHHGDLAQAIASYERSLELDPENENAKAMLREIR